MDMDRLAQLTESIVSSIAVTLAIRATRSKTRRVMVRCIAVKEKGLRREKRGRRIRRVAG
jgi:hypothetical protein